MNDLFKEMDELKDSFFGECNKFIEKIKENNEDDIK